MHPAGGVMDAPPQGSQRQPVRPLPCSVHFSDCSAWNASLYCGPGTTYGADGPERDLQCERNRVAGTDHGTALLRRCRDLFLPIAIAA